MKRSPSSPICRYALTETSCAGTLMESGDLRGHHAGAPVPSVQLKLRPWEDGGYSPYDKPSPRGEILISGGSVTRGYYNVMWAPMSDKTVNERIPNYSKENQQFD